jgi:protocatechuate 3,4-dioxygenase beta subunit
MEKNTTMFNKKYLVVFIVLLVALMTVSVAADVTNTNTKSKVTKDTSKVTNTQKIVKTNENTKKIKTNKKDNITSKKTNSKTKTEVKKTSKKNVKKDSDTADFYVSDNDGSDENQGTADAPFKTVQKALDVTKVGITNNVYIKSGLYKGLGNTNLTVDGDKIINFIGDGKDQTEFDGEAKFDIVSPVDGEPFYWGSSNKWYYYDNESGNWFMNITKGKGQISLNNLSVNHMYVIGEPGQYWHGDAANLYPIANVDNYGKLEVNNVLFYQNYGGVGSAIRNNEKATLTVNNSEFEKNQKSSSSGNQGIIYNKGTTTILNSNFHDNYARWGTILNDNKLTVINTTLKDNIGYDGDSQFKYGAGIATNSGGTDFNNQYDVSGIVAKIINSTFINIDQTSIYGSNVNLIVSGCTFQDTTGIRLIDSSGDIYNYSIENNNFNNIIESYIDKDMSSHEAKYFVLDLSISNNNVKINNNTITTEKGTIITTNTGNITNNIIKTTQKSIAILTKAGTTSAINKIEKHINIENNILNAPIELKTNNTLINNNKIVTTTDYAVNSSIPGNITVTNNYLVSLGKLGDTAVLKQSGNQVENNGPTFPNGVIFCSPDVNQPRDGTITNPTTIEDALTKIDNDATIILLPGRSNFYNITSTININEETVKEGTTTFKISALDENTVISSNVTTFNVSENYNIELSNFTMTNIEGINNDGQLNLTNIHLINNKVDNLINTTGTLNIIDTLISSNMAMTDYSSGAIMIRNTGSVNIIGNSHITDNSYAGIIGGGNLNIIGNNIIENHVPKLSSPAIFNGNNLIINGTNIFQRNSRELFRSKNNITIIGQNKFINNENIGLNTAMFGPPTGTTGDITINGENIFENNTYCRLFHFNLKPGTFLLINGSNVFRNNGQDSSSTNLINCNSNIFTIIIDGSNIFENNIGNSVINSKCEVIINGTNQFKDNIVTSSVIISSGNKLIIEGKNIFDNNIGTNGGAIQFTGINLTITGENTFSNNNATKGGAIYLTNINNVEANALIMGNIFINNYAEEGGAIYLLNQSETYTRTLEITNNSFINIKSNNETLNLPTNSESVIKNNTFINSAIGLEFSISSELEGQTIPQNTPIPITITAEPKYPKYYDADILDKITYYIYVNDMKKNETTNNIFTIIEPYNTENNGILNIYVKISEDIQSNTITVNLIKPLDTSIEITTPNENTVNKTTPITIIIKDENGQLVQGIEVTISTENKNETITLENGVIVYQYTPTTVGTETITVTYAGNSTLNPSNHTASLKITVNKDEVIEELTNTTKEQEKTITKQENTIKEEQKKVETLNNTVKKQENDIKKLTEKTKTKLTISKATATVGKKVTIKVTVKDANGKAVTGGKVSLKVNGKVLKDSNNNIIYADVSKGVANIKYLVPGSWIKQNPKIQAIYTGNDKYADSTVTKTKLIKVNKGSTTITLTPNIKSTKAGSKVTITVKHIDTNTKKGLTSKVAVKVNGKTFKVKVKNGEGVLTYTVPAGMNAKTVKVTASHSSKYYNKATSKTSFKVTKTTPTIKTTKTTYKSKKTTIKGKILDANNKVLTKNVKVTVKVDGKVVLKNKVVKKGKISLSFKKSLKKGYHELVITSKATKAFNKASFTGVLKV